jgi:bifunctional ADP-heptose synthase (sugar kinase/adenylyltransferase)
MTYLENARNFGDALLLGVNNDAVLPASTPKS